jgi:hypothetical protein
MGFPIGAEQREGLGGQRDVPVFGALATVDMDLEALPINIGDLQEEGCMKSEAPAGDGRQVDLVMQGSSGRQEAFDLLNTEDSGETVRDLRANERESIPITLENVLIDEAEAAVAAAHGRWRQAIDVFAVQEVTL